MSRNRGEMPSPLGMASKEQKEEKFESVEELLPPISAPVAKPAAPVIPPSAPAKPKAIEVYAVRDGWYAGERKSSKNVNKDGSPKTFTIKNMGELGSWMKLVDPVLQKQREEEDKKKGKGKLPLIRPRNDEAGE